jgi:putative oxidoreductase
MEGAMRIAQLLLQTDSGVVGLALRITLAVVMFPHGAQKVLGWFGGHGFRGTMKYFTDSGIPAVFALLAIAAEFLGPLGLATWFLYELVWEPERRGIRIPFACAGALRSP